MVKSLKDNYPGGYKEPYSEKKPISDFGIVLLFLIVISTIAFLFLIWRETQYLNFFKETVKMFADPIKISTPVVSIRPKIIRPQPKISEKIYSWTNENGIRQFSNIQPTGNVNGLTITEPITGKK